MALPPLYFRALSEQLLAVSAASPTQVWGLGYNNLLVQQQPDGSWKEMPALPGTQVYSFACAADGTVIAVGENRQMYRYVPEQNVPPLADGNPWRAIPGITNIGAIAIGSRQWTAVANTASGATSIELYMGEGQTQAIHGNPALFDSAGRICIDAEGYIHAVGENTKELWTTNGPMMLWPLKSTWCKLDIEFEHDILGICQGNNGTRFIICENAMFQLVANSYLVQVQPILRTWNGKTSQWDTTDLKGPYGWISGYGNNQLYLQTNPSMGNFVMHKTLVEQNPTYWPTSPTADKPS